MSDQIGYCIAPFLAIAICVAFPVVLWTILDVLSGRDFEDYTINTLLGRDK